MLEICDNNQSEGGTPERIIQVPGCVDAWQLGYVSRLRLQTRGLKVLTDAECMPDLTVQSPGGKVSRNAYSFIPFDGAELCPGT